MYKIQLYREIIKLDLFILLRINKIKDINNFNFSYFEYQPIFLDHNRHYINAHFHYNIVLVSIDLVS
jgi:hypothetical protein